MLRVEVKNLGPIAEGIIDLKPLTVFIGKNNIGKSYMAMLIYAAMRTSRHGNFPEFPLGLFDPPMRFFYDTNLLFRNSFVHTVTETKALDKGGRISSAPEIDLQQLREQVAKTTVAMADTFAKGLAHELQRCFATTVSRLKRQRQSVNGLGISFKTPKMYMKFSCSDAIIKAFPPEADISDDLLRRTLGKAMKQVERLHIKDAKETRAYILGQSVSEILMSLVKEIQLKPYYLPAARSGILQSHKALASYIVSRSPLAGIEDMEIPKFSGVIADFLGSLLRLEKRKPGKLNALAKFLEEDLTKGEIEIKVDEHQYPEIFYRSAAGRFALHRTSSMVSELAPIILFFRHIVEPGDLLIIEEPEAHLHPENQRKMAKALVGLVRTGVKVIITTHSDYLLDQLSNYVCRGQLSVEERAEQNVGQDDYLGIDDIGVYLFKHDEAKGGTVVQGIKVTPEDGIADEEFTKVAKELYEETYQLRRKLLVKS
ncbi:MAG: hypothetical protein HW384_673 [Dehalococcoidia bacterium]|nr:hypothetical protein [Dehalococcoidia bacterium]